MNFPLPEELQELSLSRRIDHLGVPHFQTLTGHIQDLLKTLHDFIEAHEDALQDCCKLCAVSPTEFYKSLFAAVGLNNFFKLDDTYQHHIRLKEFNADGEYKSLFPEHLTRNLCIELYKNADKDRFYGNAGKSNGEADLAPDHEQINRLWRRFSAYYLKFNFDRWFSGERTLPLPKEAPILQKDFGSVSGRKLKRITQDKTFQRLYGIMQYCVSVCFATADREFLKKVFQNLWDQPYVIHGSVVSGFRTRERIFKTIPRSLSRRTMTLSHNINPEKSMITCYSAYSERKRMQKAADWIKLVSTRDRITIVAPTEEHLISLGYHLKKELALDTYNFYYSGLVKFCSRNFESLDTKIFDPERASDQIATFPVESGAASLYTYHEFFHRLFDSDAGAVEFRGAVMTRSLLLWGAPSGNGELQKRFAQLVQFAQRNAIPTLILLPGHEGIYKKIIRRSAKNVGFTAEDSEIPIAPVLIQSPYIFLEDSRSLHPEFVSALVKDFRRGVNQLVLGPNPLYVQKIYHELNNLFSKKRLPVRSVQMYHGLYELRDKPVKKANIEAALRRSPAVVVSTLSLFPDIFSLFPVIFVERLPFDEGIVTLFNLVQDYRPAKNRILTEESEQAGVSRNNCFPVPHILWSTGDVQPDSIRFSMAEEFDGAVTPRKLQRWVKLSQSRLTESENYRRKTMVLPAIPYCSLEPEKEVNALHRFMFPAESYTEFNGLVKGRISDHKLLYKHKSGTTYCTLPYHSNLGVIGPPEWMEDYMP